MTLTFGSLFAGIAGLDLGLERAGMICKWQVEIDDFCTKVLEKHWPDVARYRDVRECGKHNLEAVDLICGGFPCQPHSVAGKRRGAADDRNLWPEFSRIIAELQPRYVLAENVPGIVTTYLDTVLSDLESQAYTVATFNIPACAFDAPHRRERIFVVAYATGDFDGSSEIMANAELSYGTSRWNRSTSQHQTGTKWEAVVTRSGREGSRGETEYISRWPIEPNVGRVADGVPNRVDRLRALGNAVVPQVAEWIGRRIMEVEQEQSQ